MTQFQPMSVTAIELADPLPEVVLVAEGRPRLRVLVRVLERPIGFVELMAPPSGVTGPQLAEACELQLGPELSRVRSDHGLANDVAVTGLPGALAGRARPFSEASLETPISVVISTRDRPESLLRTLRSIAALDAPTLEVVVVDNAARTDATKVVLTTHFADDPRFRYVAEPRPGLSRGRNKGLAEASHELVAYTDDDTEADRFWLHAIAAAFAANPDAGCVTGLVPTASMDSEAQDQFDRRVSWSSNCTPNRYTLDTDPPPQLAYPFCAGLYGTGANFAVKKSMMEELGGFDVLLGAGAPTKGGEDLDAFVRVILAGHAIVFEPASIVWHHHRADEAALRKQLYGYGLGLSAYITKQLVSRSTALEVLKRVPSGAKLFTTARKDDVTEQKLPWQHTAIEALGFVAGPAVYAKARVVERFSRSS